jgi:hypothetical protein
MVREDPDLDAPVADADRQRFERLTHAGFAWADAVALAVHPEADVELALSLVAQGCSPPTAAQIVAPVDEPARPPLHETQSTDEPVRDTVETDAKHLG